MTIELTSEQSLQVFEDVLEEKSHEFIAKKVSEKLSIGDIIKPIPVQELLNEIDNSDILAHCFNESLISDENVTLTFRNGRTLAHNQMIEAIQKCLDQFVDPNKITEKLEELL